MNNELHMKKHLERSDEEKALMAYLASGNSVYDLVETLLDLAKEVADTDKTNEYSRMVAELKKSVAEAAVDNGDTFEEVMRGYVGMYQDLWDTSNKCATE